MCTRGIITAWRLEERDFSFALPPDGCRAVIFSCARLFVFRFLFLWGERGSITGILHTQASICLLIKLTSVNKVSKSSASVFVLQ